MKHMCLKYPLRKSIFSKINKYYHGVKILHYCRIYHLNSKDCPINVGRTLEIIYCGHLNLIRMLFHLQYPFKYIDPYDIGLSMYIAMIYNHLDIFKWLYFNRYKIDGCSRETLNVAIKKGHHDISAFIYSQKELFVYLTNNY
jgi:hypothetical protein